jgi:hypothetical protein
VSPNGTFLEAYNCDGSEAPRPEWADRARKQLYRADYVLYHFVHYSTVTRGYLPTYKDEGAAKWERYYAEEEPSERVTDEIHEATMIHTKRLDFGQTMAWRNRCRMDSKRKWLGCFIGFPWPNNTKVEEEERVARYDENGMEYNCFVNDKVENYWISRLEEALKKRKTQGMLT